MGQEREIVDCFVLGEQWYHDVKRANKPNSSTSALGLREYLADEMGQVQAKDYPLVGSV